MLFDRFRVEEDLERIKRANMSLDERILEEKRAQRAKYNAGKIGFKDAFAMTIAIFSLVLPYVLLFFGIILVAMLMMISFW